MTEIDLSLRHSRKTSSMAEQMASRKLLSCICLVPCSAGMGLLFHSVLTGHTRRFLYAAESFLKLEFPRESSYWSMIASSRCLSLRFPHGWYWKFIRQLLFHACRRHSSEILVIFVDPSASAVSACSRGHGFVLLSARCQDTAPVLRKILGAVISFGR